MRGVSSSSLVLSFNVSQLLITEKLGGKEEGLITPKLYKITKRHIDRERVMNKFITWISSLLKSIEEDEIDEWLGEESQELISNFDKTKITEKEKKKLENFYSKINEISEKILEVKDYYPLTLYLSETLNNYPKFIDLDFQLYNKYKREKYRKLFIESLKEFPEKSIFLGSFMIAIYLLEGGKLNLKQEFYLTSVFHKFLNLVEPLHYFDIKFEEDELKMLPESIGR